MKRILALCTAAALSLAQPLKVAILWHQHQPPYENPLTGEYEGPWVRMHGVNDYPWMAEVLKEFPGIKVTFDYTSTLLKQIEDYLSGRAKDAYQRLSEKPLSALTFEERAFIRERFFDINPRFIEKSPRYKDLRDKKNRGEPFSDQDLQDLRVLWNLYWINIDYIRKDPRLNALYQKDQQFTQDDLEYVLKKHLELMARILPLHKELFERGQIDLITTPFYHPILPILLEKEAIQESNPTLKLPTEPIAWPEDAAWQVEAGLRYFEKIFGVLPVGMWPPEGAVSQKAAELYAQRGVRFLVTDEAILGRSGFSTAPESLTRIYHVEKEGARIHLFFRHRDLSDRIGFAYSQMAAEQAVEDFIAKLLEIREAVKGNPNAVLTIALDGENAWENYPENGNTFRRLLYKRLSEEQEKGTLQTVLFKDLLELSSVPIPRLATGGWAGDFAMWAGEPEENEAWDRLSRARQAVERYRAEGGAPEVVEKAMGLIYAAQASDWFWWYGQDTAFPNNPPFDEAFRALLRAVYATLGQKPPEELSIAVRPPIQLASSPGRVQPALDGRASSEEWRGAGYLLDLEAKTMQTQDDLIKGVYLGFDEQNIYLWVDLRDGVLARSLVGQGYQLHVYATLKGASGGAAFPLGGEVSLGFPLQQRISLDFNQVQDGQAVLIRYVYENGAWVLASSPRDLAGRRAFVDEVVELRIPYITLKVDAGDTLSLALVLNGPDGRILDTAPNQNPIALSLPQRLSGREVLRIQDPEGDEHGPGTYTYPLDAAFSPHKGLFDLLEMRVLDAGATWTFVFTFKEMTNPWGAPAGFSHQLINVYLDYKEGGKTEPFAPGAKVVFDPDHPWDLFLKAAGWPQYGQRVGYPDGRDTVDGLVVSSNSADKAVILQLDKKLFSPENGQKVCFYVLVGSQDGYGPDHFRPVVKEAGPWNLGGALNEDAPLVVDYLWPEGGVQEGMLSQYGKGKYATLEPLCVAWP